MARLSHAGLRRRLFGGDHVLLEHGPRRRPVHEGCHVELLLDRRGPTLERADEPPREDADAPRADSGMPLLGCLSRPLSHSSDLEEQGELGSVVGHERYVRWSAAGRVLVTIMYCGRKVGNGKERNGTRKFDLQLHVIRYYPPVP